jgi:hypothetical protein
MTGLAMPLQTARAAPPPRTGSVLQRKCACGGSTAALSGGCEACRGKRAGVQAKLQLGPVDDRYEREADRAADAIGRDAAAPEAQPSPIRVQRLCSASAAAGAAPERITRVLAAPGRPLDGASRALMEGRFGHGFDHVRVHTDGEAAASTRDIGARAYTHGAHIAFAVGEYRPETQVGRRLLAHELAHVVQQSGAAEAPVQRDLAVEPQGVTKVERTLSEKDIKDAIAFNKTRIRNKQTLRTIRDIVGVSPDPAVSDRALALGVARWQASHGVAQDGQLGPVTVLLLVEELQAEAELVPDLAKAAGKLKGEFSKAFVDVDASHCGCKTELEDEVRTADRFIGHYAACGADPANKTGNDIEACVKTRVGSVTVLGSTSSTGAITLSCQRTGPCAKMLCAIDLAHEQIHSVFTGELKQKHGADAAAFAKEFNDATTWVADEINSRNTDKSLAKWALAVLKRTCP